MQGFTLVELLIVLVLLSIVAGVAQPVITSSLTQSRLESAAGDVTSALHYARRTAMNTGQTCMVTFDAAAETLNVQRLTHQNISTLLDPNEDELLETVVDVPGVWAYTAADSPTLPGNAYTVDLDSDGVDIVSATFGSDSSVIWSATGQADDGGTVVLELGGKQLSVNVSAVGGGVSLGG